MKSIISKKIKIQDQATISIVMIYFSVELIYEVIENQKLLHTYTKYFS